MGTHTNKPHLYHYSFQVLPVVIYFSACISVFYYLGVMQVVIAKLEERNFLARSSRAESGSSVLFLFVCWPTIVTVEGAWESGWEEARCER